MDAFARWLTRHPLAVVVANLAVTAVLGLYAVHIRIENSLESMLPAGDPKVAYYNATNNQTTGDRSAPFPRSDPDAAEIDLEIGEERRAHAGRALVHGDFTEAVAGAPAVDIARP